MQILTAEEFCRLQARLGKHYTEMAEYLGVSERTVMRYRKAGIAIMPDALRTVLALDKLGVNWKERLPE